MSHTISIAIRPDINDGIEYQIEVALLAHNTKVLGSNPSPTTKGTYPVPFFD